jgi:tetratricopeptide (TPR) repeat protein
MSTPIQNIDSIGPVHEKAGSEPQKTQAQLDYEEGRGYVERGESALAAVALHNALRGFEEENNREGMANASNQLGHACLLRKQYDKALVHYRNTYELCEELGDPVSLLTVSKQLAETHRGLKQFRQALDICLDLLDSYQRNNDPKNSVEILERMAQIYIDANEPEKGADAFKTAASIHANFGHKKLADELRKKAADLLGGASTADE